MTRKIILISLSNISKDGRVLRQINYLSKSFHILVVGYGNPPKEFINHPNIQWMKLRRLTSTMGTIQRLFERFFLIPFFPKLHPVFKLLHQTACDAIHVNNWDSLPMGALLAKKAKAKLILDIHESYDSWYWGLGTPTIKSIFRKYGKMVDASTTVVEALAKQHQKYCLDPIVVMNAPEATTETKNEIKKDGICMIHHGAADPSRHLETMIETLALCDQRYTLTMMLIPNNSAYTKRLMALSEKIVSGRVTFLDPVTPSEIIQTISGFDLGFYPLRPRNFNQQIALPNKFFDFLAAGLAVCIGPSSSMAQLVKKYRCGVIADSFEPEELSRVLNQTTKDQWDEMKKASQAAAKVLNAEIEMGKVLQIYNKIFSED